MRSNEPSPFDLPMLRAIGAGKVTRDDCDGTRKGYFALYVLDGEPVGRNRLAWLHRKGLISDACARERRQGDGQLSQLAVRQ